MNITRNELSNIYYDIVAIIVGCVAIVLFVITLLSIYRTFYPRVCTQLVSERVMVNGQEFTKQVCLWK
jgi:hypothetical protein